MTAKLKSADIVIVGLGWTGGILAKELADTNLSIVVLERGAPRDTNPDFMYPTVHDELRYAQRHELMQNVSRETLTFRNTASEIALPMRQLGSFLPGEGVGGAGVHERRDLAVVALGPGAAQAHPRPLRQGRHSARYEPAGLGGLLRRARALLRQVRVSVWNLGQSRQSARRKDRGRQRI